MVSYEGFQVLPRTENDLKISASCHAWLYTFLVSQTSKKSSDSCRLVVGPHDREMESEEGSQTQEREGEVKNLPRKWNHK